MRNPKNESASGKAFGAEPHVELLDTDLDDDLVVPELELGFSVDVARKELADGDDMGLRSLYEHPESILGRLRWARAA